jgi:hypothetical protein
MREGTPSDNSDAVHLGVRKIPRTSALQYPEAIICRGDYLKARLNAASFRGVSGVGRLARHTRLTRQDASAEKRLKHDLLLSSLEKPACLEKPHASSATHRRRGC